MFILKTVLWQRRKQDLEDDNIECLWVELTPTKGKPFLLGTVYRNPAERSDWLDRYENLIDKALTDKKELIMLGDFNKDLLKTNQTRDWVNSMTALGFTQLVNCPTRVTNSTSTLIDHIYTTNEENISDARVAQIGLSDHYAIFCSRKINFSLKSNSHKTMKYRSFKSFYKENEFLQDLSAVSWSELELLENVDTMLDVWYDFLMMLLINMPLSKRIE